MQEQNFTSGRRADRRPPARLGFPSCPACGAIALSPAHSQFVSECVVQHCWACEDCGYLFVSRVGVLDRVTKASGPLVA